MKQLLFCLLIPLLSLSQEEKKVFSGNFDLGINFTKTTEKTLQFKNVFLIKYRVNNVYWITASNNMSLITATGENDLINKGVQEIKYSLVDKGWDLGINIEHLYDISKNIKNRYSTALGFSYNISKIKNEKLAFGLSFQREKELTTDKKSTLQNRLNANFYIAKRIAENLEINISNGYLPNFVKFSDFRWKSTLDLNIKLTAKFLLSISTVYNYDSNPSEGIPQSDYQLINTVSYTF
jgi:hypothetical protein